MKQSTLREIVQAVERKRSVALVTNLEDNSEQIFRQSELNHSQVLESKIIDLFAKDRSQLVELAGVRYFVQIFNPPLRLLIVGAVHIAKPLVLMAQECAYDVTLIDPRRAFASSARFPNVKIVNEWPDRALEKLKLDHRTAVVTLTHDPKLDEPALVTALGSNAFYIGALGSRRTHEKRCKRLKQAGIKDSSMNRICAPVGLNIAAVSPAEIAVSIMAQLTRSLRRRETP